MRAPYFTINAFAQLGTLWPGCLDYETPSATWAMRTPPVQSQTVP
jgi:hypothetical protein